MDHKILFLKYCTRFHKNYESYKLSNKRKYVARMTKALKKLNDAFQCIDFQDNIKSCQFYMGDLLQCNSIYHKLN